MPRELNVVYIGRKPRMSYVLAIITIFTGTDAKEVVLKAMTSNNNGRAITTAVDVARASETEP